MKMQKGIHLSKGSRKIFSPEDKTAKTCERMIGRISLKQYLLLVDKGYDGNIIMKWTKYKAFNEIKNIFEKSKK
jgi:hypothetical protein